MLSVTEEIVVAGTSLVRAWNAEMSEIISVHTAVRIILARKSNRILMFFRSVAFRPIQHFLSRPITRRLQVAGAELCLVRHPGTQSAPDMLPGSYQAGQLRSGVILAALCLQSPGSSRLAPRRSGKETPTRNRALR